MAYNGIDYGMGQTNVDRETGIRYGVIPPHQLHDFALESFEDDYGPATCPKCGNEVSDYDDEAHGQYEQYHDCGCADYACEDCETTYDSSDCFGDEPISSTCVKDGYSLQLDSDNEVWVLKSPYYTHAQYCSPCAPGACYLSNPVGEDGPRAYCLGADWFNEGKAPYPVYLVATGERVS